MDTEPSVIVIGAGIVGAAIARALQRDGHKVTLVDSDEPGRAIRHWQMRSWVSPTMCSGRLLSRS